MGVIKNSFQGIKKFFGWGGSWWSSYRTGSEWVSLNGILQKADAEVLKPYETNILVYAAIKKIGDCMVRAPFELQQTSTRGKKKTLVDGDLYELHLNPNPYQNGKEFLRSVISWKQYRGEAFIVFDGRESIWDVPKRMWTFDPHCFTPVFDTEFTELLGWELNQGVKAVFISRENVLHIKTFNPASFWRGMPPTNPAQNSIDQYYYANSFNTNFFKNGAIFSGFLITKEELSDDSYNRLVKSWEDRHVGDKKAHKIGILEGGLDFKPATFTHKDMDFPNLMGSTKKDILIAWHMSDVILGEYSDIKSYEGINAILRSFWEELLIPEMLDIEYAWNAGFLRRVAPKVKSKFILDDIEALREGYGRRVEFGNRLMDLGYTQNQINDRLDLGMPENPWGNVAFFKDNRVPVASLEDTSNLIPIASSGSGQQQLNDESENEDDENDTDDTDDTKSKRWQLSLDSNFKEIRNNIEEFNKKQEEKQQKIEQIKLSYLKIQQDLEKQYKSRLKKFFWEQRGRVLNIFYEKITNETDINEKEEFNWILEEEKEIKNFKNYMESLYQETGKKASDFAHTLNPIKDSTLIYDKNYQYVELIEKLGKVSQDIIKTVKQLLINSLNQGFNKSETRDLLSKRIRNIYNLISNQKCDILATNETGTNLSYIIYNTMKEFGITEHQWISLDDNTKHLDGQITQIGRTFIDVNNKDTGLCYPGDSPMYSELIILNRDFSVPII